MSILNLDEQAASEPSSKVLILRIILMLALGIAGLAGAAFAGYYYAKNEQTISQLEALRREIGGSRYDRRSDLSSKIDDLQSGIDEIKRDVDDIESKVSNIEIDVSSIQLKIGY